MAADAALTAGANDAETRRRVVITGMGCLSPLGNDLDTTWQGIREGRSGIGPVTRFDASRLPTHFAGEVKDFDPTTVIDRKTAKRMDRFQHYALAASIEALRRSGLEITPANAERIGVVIGSGIGGIESLTEQMDVLRDKGPSRVSPFLITMMVIDLAPGFVSIVLGAKGPNYATVSACATGAHAIGEASSIIRRGQADAMIAGGTEAGVVEVGMASFCNMRALSRRNDAPQQASRPFDAERDGFVIAEGAGVVILEELEHARRRNAPILAELVGYGQTADAHHMTEPAPEGEGAARAMAMALANAGLRPDQIQYINAHATSTQVGDGRETEAIKSVFGEHAYTLAVSSTKSMTGHLVGAAGGLESIICVKALCEGFLPPTINLEHPDPECDLDYVPNEGRDAPLHAVMNNGYGFGGHNVSLVFQSVRDDIHR
jgi:3-oxoacyl-[acyl-carrier-protein] synthase II